MQLEVHLSVELCLHSSGYGGGHMEQLGKPCRVSLGCRKPPQPSSNAALRWSLGLGLVPWAWREQERVVLGPALGLWPALLFEHRYSQTIGELQLATKPRLGISHGWQRASLVKVCIDRSGGADRAVSPRGLGDGLFNWCQ